MDEAAGPCTVDNKTRCKNRKLLQNEVNSKTGTVTSPKGVWILAPWGPQHRQEIPLRGHGDAGAFSLNETGCNDGVFKAALRQRVEAADKQTSDLFLKAPRNPSYLSWRVQNQIVYLMGDAIQK